jgi:hypothetical protein
MNQPSVTDEASHGVERTDVLARFVSNQGGQPLTVRARSAGAAPQFAITDSRGEIELSQRQLEWLLIMSGPAALARVRAQERTADTERSARHLRPVPAPS